MTLRQTATDLSFYLARQVDLPEKQVDSLRFGLGNHYRQPDQGNTTFRPGLGVGYRYSGRSGPVGGKWFSVTGRWGTFHRLCALPGSQLGHLPFNRLDGYNVCFPDFTRPTG